MNGRSQQNFPKNPSQNNCLQTHQQHFTTNDVTSSKTNVQKQQTPNNYMTRIERKVYK